METAPGVEGTSIARFITSVSIDGTSLVSADLKGHLKAWDIKGDYSMRDIARVEALHKYDPTFRADIGGARSIAFRSDGAQLAIGGITNVTNAFAGIGEKSP